MKSRTFRQFSAITLFAALAIPAKLAAQQHHHYRLIDLGTFGGPVTLVNGEPTENDIINNGGTIVGGADTSIPAPPTPPPGCYNPVNRNDCFISLAFAWNHGHPDEPGNPPRRQFQLCGGNQ
jgi:hypothetical protein